MANLSDFLQNDQLWQKTKAGQMKTEKKLSRKEYLRAVGADSYTEEAYLRYVRSWQVAQIKQDELPF